MSSMDAAVTALLEADAAALAQVVAADPAVLAETLGDGSTLLILCAHAVTTDTAIPAIDQYPTYAGVLDVLIDAGADVDATMPSGSTALHCAAMAGNEALTGRLLAAGADVSIVDRGVAGATAMNFALFYAKTDTAQLIDTTARFPDDLRSAAGLGDLDRVRGWLGDERGALVGGADAGMAFTAPIEAFPPRTAHPGAQTTLDESLTWASRNGQVEVMAALADHGADVNANPYRGTALLWAIYSDCVPSAAWLLDHGADPDLRHDFGGAEHGFGATAMHLAAQFEAMDCLRLLLDRGADPTVTDARWEGTPLDWARECESQTSLAYLEARLG